MKLVVNNPNPQGPSSEVAANGLPFEPYPREIYLDLIAELVGCSVSAERVREGESDDYLMHVWKILDYYLRGNLWKDNRGVRKRWNQNQIFKANLEYRQAREYLAAKGDKERAELRKKHNGESWDPSYVAYVAREKVLYEKARATLPPKKRDDPLEAQRLIYSWEEKEKEAKLDRRLARNRKNWATEHVVIVEAKGQRIAKAAKGKRKKQLSVAKKSATKKKR